MEILIQRSDNKIVIFVGSQAAIVSLTENEVMDMKKILLYQTLIGRGGKIALQWVHAALRNSG